MAQAIEWVQTITAIPGDVNPLNDTTGEFARLADVGDTLYLAGSFADDVRKFDVDFGDKLVVPLVNTWSDEFTATLPDLREDVLNFTESLDITEVFLRVDVGNDGHYEFDKTFDISEVTYFPEIDFPCETEKAREFFVEPEPGDKFVFEFPDNITLGDDFPPEGGESESYTTGYYAVIKGLPKGEHKLEFGGTVAAFGLEASVTDIINVVNPLDGENGYSDGNDGADPCSSEPTDGGQDWAPVEACDWIC
jgi:hypothetical protein